MDTAMGFGLNILKNSEGLQVEGNEEFSLAARFGRQREKHWHNFMPFYYLI